jgi:serine/threonine protein kinase
MRNQVDHGYKRVYICDMGIARTKQLAETTVTCNSKGPGTYPYMAPEMFMRSRRGPAVDVYSLGCLYIELFGRQRVWGQLDGPAIMQKVLGSYRSPPQGPSTNHLHPTVAGLCSQMCELNAYLRPSSNEVLHIMQTMTCESNDL